MVLILGERLASVSTDFDRMRAKRFEHALKERRRGPRIGLAEARAAREGSSAQTNGRPAAAFEAGHKQHPSQVTKQQVQAQVLETEQDRLLVQELESMADSVKEAEGKILEMSALNHLFSTHIQEQAQQLERLYEQVGNLRRYLLRAFAWHSF